MGLPLKDISGLIGFALYLTSMVRPCDSTIMSEACSQDHIMRPASATIIRLGLLMTL